MTRVCAVLIATTAAALLALTPERADAQKWYEKAVKSVEAKFTPAEAKPGQTVTFTLTIELNEGYNTYPTAQPEKAAAGLVNVIEFPGADKLVFVGKTEDPKEFTTKEEPVLGVKQLHINTGKVTYTRKAVVSPKAAAGEAKVKLPLFSLSVCEKDKCFPAKNVPVEVAFKVLGGAAVPVEAAFAAEVAKALEKK